MSHEAKEIYSARVPAGSRTYFVDLKQSKDGVSYLVLSESRQVDSRYEHHRIMVFEENLQAFCHALDQAVDLFETKVNRKHSTTVPNVDASKRAYSVGEKRKGFSNAYAKWTADDDLKLRELFAEGRTVGELSKDFGRNEGAIRSRLVKLGFSMTVL